MINLRAPEQGDVDRIFLWENDPGLFEVLPNAAPLSRLQVWEYIQNYNADPFSSRELRMMIEDSDISQTVGYIDIFEFDPVNRRAGIAIYINEDNRCRGYASQALEKVGEYAHNTLAIHQLWAIVAIDNEPSRALFTNAGFKPCGRLRSWLRRKTHYIDALFFQKLFP